MKHKIAVLFLALILASTTVPDFGVAYAASHDETNQSNIGIDEENIATLSDNVKLETNDQSGEMGVDSSSQEELSTFVSEQQQETDISYESALAASERANMLQDGYYTMGNGNLVVDMYHGGYADNVQAVPYPLSDQNNQLFYFEKQSSGHYKITAVHSGKALTVQQNGTIVQSKWTGSANQQWRVIENLGGSYYLRSVESGKALTFDNVLTCSDYTQSSNQKINLIAQDTVFNKTYIAVVEDGTYELRSALTGHNLDVESGNWSNGGKVLQYTPHDGNNQKWYLKNRSDGTVVLESLYTGKYLDMNVGTDKCVQWEYHGGPNQQWVIGRVSGNYYIKNVATGKALDIYQSTMDSGDYVIGYPLHLQINQQWHFVETTPVWEQVNTLQEGYYTIGNGNLVVDMYHGGYADNVQAVLYQPSDQNNQLFHFERASDGNYKITAVHSGKALTAQQNGTIVQSKWIGSANQQWKVIKTIDGSYYLQSVESGKALTFDNELICSDYLEASNQEITFRKQDTVFDKVHVAVVEDGTYELRSALTGHNLDVESGNLSNGGRVLQYTPHDGDNQKWYLKNRSDGTVVLESLYSGKYLDLNVGTDKCVQWEYHGGPNQQWIIGEVSGNYYIQNAATGKALDIYQSTMTSGDYVIAYPSHMGINQQWQFIESAYLVSDIQLTSSLGNNFENCQTTTLSVSNPNGANYQYQFSINYDNRNIILQHYSSSTTCNWTPIDTGTYIVNVSMIDPTGKKSTLSRTMEIRSNGQRRLTGIDVSVWQGNIDWGAVKNSGTVQYAMLRAGYGRELHQKDTQFERNYAGATSHNIPVGVYHYSYANTVEDALREAEACLQMLGGKALTLPVAYDIEDTKSLVGVDRKTLTDIAIAFCDRIKEAGYQPMVYCNPDYVNNRLDVTRLREKGYDMWIAHYGVSDYQMPYPVKMWQYTSTGRVAGINGNVDMNYWYVGADYNGNTPLPAGQKGQCTVESLNVRNHPSTVSGQVLYLACKGYTFTILEESNGWYRVSFGGGREGWVYGNYIQLI